MGAVCCSPGKEGNEDEKELQILEMNRFNVDQTHFDLTRLVGKGGFAEVYLAVHKLTGDKLAIKRIQKREVLVLRSTRKSRSKQKHANGPRGDRSRSGSETGNSNKVSRHSSSKGSQDKQTRDWSLRTVVFTERNAMIGLMSPFLMPIFNAFQDHVYLYLTMPFMEGGDLGFYIRKTKLMNEREAKFYAAELILALEELHMSHHIVYRDLKPSNVLMSVDGHICITDFGLCAQLRAEKDWQSTGNVGTVGYQAPEVVQRRPYGFGVDFFSLGVTIFRIITGKRPYGKQGNYNMPVDYSYFSKDLTSLLKGLLDLDPDKRLGYRLGGHSAEYLATQLPHQRKSNSQKSISVAGRDPPPRVRWADVKNHAFFSDIDWKAIANKVVEPPLKPRKQQVDKSPKHASFAETEMKKFNQFACNFPRSNSLRHDSRNRTGKKSNKYPALPLSKDQHKLFDGFEYNVRLNPNDLTLLENNLAMQQGGHSQRKSRHPQSENNSRNAPGEPQLTSVLPLAIFKTGPGDDPFRRRDNTKTQQTAKRSSSQLGHDAPKWTLKKEASISLRSSQLEESR